MTQPLVVACSCPLKSLKRKRDEIEDDMVQFYPIPCGYDIKKFFEPEGTGNTDEHDEDEDDKEFVPGPVCRVSSKEKIDWGPVKPGSIKSFFDSCKKTHTS